jgi:hypothetical protein
MTMTVATARVRWGNPRFWRINEFASVDDAREFAAALREMHGSGVQVSVETRDEKDRWIVLAE